MPDDRTGKSPAFQFYPKDFLNDEKQIRMSATAAGIYIRLLCHCWNEGSLPQDPHVLAKMAGASNRQLADLWPSIAPCFRVTEDGRLIQPRLEREREKQLTYRQRQSDRGKASAAIRSTLVEARLNAGSTLVEPRPVEQALLNSSSSSSSAVCSLQTPVKRALPSDLDEKWLAFQQAYPGNRREGGRIVFDGFRLACESVGYEALMAALLRHKQTESWQRGFAPGMAKWFEKTMWIQTPDTPADAKAEGLRKFEAELARIDAEKAARGR